MSYQVLARKWRPGRFEEIVGQEHVLRAMVNALEQGRLHHAYLFTGTRGVGKTTLARILAKCLNCEQGVTAHPCGECSACREIAEGRFVDLIEVDAASRTKVDDTRELLDNVQYAPTAGRFKVYLIDEVHMLSTHSFNALLKTLEEPPPHVKFLLATTDPQKLPVTVLSRCLQFNLKRVPERLIAEHLAHVLAAEGVEHEPAALRLLARAAEGSLRDALSLLDQAIAFGDGAVREDDVGQMLGTVSRRYLFQLMDAVAAGDAAMAMQHAAALDQLAPDYDGILAGLVTLLHDIALVQQVPDSLDLLPEDGHELSALASLMAPEDVQLCYEIALRARRDLPLVPDGRLALEMALLRMLAFRPVEAAPATAQGPAVPASAPAGAGAGASRPAIPDASPPPAAPRAAPAPPPPTDTVDEADWEAILGQLSLTGVTRQLAHHCSLVAVKGGRVELRLASQHESLLSDAALARLGAALGDYWGRPVKVHVQIDEAAPDSPAARARREARARQLAAEAAIESDPVVKGLKETFDADLVPGSIQPEND